MNRSQSISQSSPQVTKASFFFGSSAGQLQRTTFFGARPVIQRQQALDENLDLCIGITAGPNAGPQRADFTPRQHRRVVAAKFEALRLLSRALLGLSAFDPYIIRIAQGIFRQSSPDRAQLINTVEQIRDRLSSASITKGTCYDEGCNESGVKGHAVRADNEIILCNRLFSLSVWEIVRVLIHEAAHNVGIDAARVANHDPESYCNEEANMHWRDRCNNLSDPVNNVDAWAWFVEYAAFGY